MNYEILQLLWIFALLNVLTGFYEVYCFMHRDKFIIEKRTFWSKLYSNQLSRPSLDPWMEYLKVDPRYITKQYVWVFELVNAGLALLFLIALILQKFNIIKYVCIILITNCSLYFLTLLFEIKNDKKIKDSIDLYSQSWMWIYYLISSIYLLVPLYIFISI